jgi:hypothetical protein
MRTRFPSLLAVTILSMQMMNTYAAPPDSVAKGERAKHRSRSITADDTAKAIAFATEHHAELATLLERLRENSQNEFEHGIRDVHRAVSRLDRIREKQPAKFASELEIWKAESRIRLLTAKWLMSQDPKLEEQIRHLLSERQLSRIARLEAEHTRAENRLQQLEQQLAEAREATAVDREWERLRTRSTNRSKQKRSKVASSKPKEPSAVDKAVVAD